MQTLKP